MNEFNDGTPFQVFIGQLGHFGSILTFIAAIFTTYAYAKSFRSDNPTQKESWKKIARLFLYVEFLAIITIVVSLYVILYNHLYQYKFAYKHSDNSLPIKYLFSCFWEGQEGSFILWLFWHAVISLLLLRSAKSWEAPVIMGIQFVQIFLAAFLLGLHFGDFHIGSSPFVLLRESDMGTDIKFNSFDYLKNVTNGQGLNRTLQDPWMVIHPPTLFFGFALCSVPAAFAIAALLKKDYAGWVKPALPWTVLATCILGVGILMGAKWAYQSLSFGGYWAWDPVENASLVPWLIIVACLHCMLIFKATQRSLKSSVLFAILTFIFIIYSTCLTRTGVLGETSVHSFTGTGIVMQLWLFLSFVVLPPVTIYIIHQSKIPVVKKEEHSSSREFWMMIASIVFLFSGLFVITVTSLPVFNKILGTNWALGEKTTTLYNNVHVPLVIVIGILIGCTQYLKYKKTSPEFQKKKQFVPIIISIILGALFLYIQPIQYSKEGEVYKYLIAIAVMASIYGLIANITYWIDVVKSKAINWGSSLTHIGFSLMLVGFLISSANQKILSMNKPMFNIFGDDKTNDPKENLNLIKGMPLKMGKYNVTYVSDTVDDISADRQYYKVKFQDSTNNKVFYLNPNAFLRVEMNGKEGIQPNPDFKNYWDKDLFLYITSLIDPLKKDAPAEFIQKPLKMGDTAFLVNGYFFIKNQKINGTRPSSKDEKLNIEIELEIEVSTMDGKKFTTRPKYILKNDKEIIVADSVLSQNLIFKCDGFSNIPEKATDTLKYKISVKDDNKVTDYITVKVLEFPNINFIWIGMSIMSIGFMIAMYRRIKEIAKSDK